MVRTAIGFLLGCLLISQLSVLPSTAFWLGLGIVLLVTILFRWWIISAFILALSFSAWQASDRLNDRLIEEHIGVDLTVTGTIQGIPQQQTNRVRFVFRPDENALTLPSNIRLNWYFPPKDVPAAGETWQLTMRLKPPHGMANPGSFDYEGWLFQQNIGATGYVRDAPQNQRIAEAPFSSIHRWRQSIATTWEKLLGDSPNLPLIQGLTVGLRDNLQPQHWSVLRDTGTSHLLAISGLHIGLAAGLGFFAFRWLWSIRSGNLLVLPAISVGAVGGLTLAWFYALLAGMSIPSQRAVVMISIFMLALLFRRNALSYQLLAGSLICVLLIDPFSVLSAGLWLSFMAVAIILYVSQNRHPAPRWMWAKIHIWIALALSPFLLLFFSQTSVIAPAANIIAVPLVSFLVVPLLLIAVMLLAISESWASYPLIVADWLLTHLWWGLDFLAGLPAATWETAALPWPIILSALLGIAVLLAPRGLPTRSLGLFLLIPALTFSPDRPAEGDYWFTLLDVGQGLASVVQTQSHTLVFDSGPRFGDFDTGQAVVVPFLQKQGVQNLDALIISHGDNDHIGGADSILAALPVDTRLINTPELLEGSSACLAGQQWIWDGVTFEILYPYAHSKGSPNDLSCVLKISGRGGSTLLTGDIERRAEFSLLRQQREKLTADILLAPHHGSQTSSNEAFIDAVNPRYALFATGYLNRYQFPARAVVERYDARDISMFNTADSGALLFKIEADQPIRLKRWRQHARRLWTASPTD